MKRLENFRCLSGREIPLTRGGGIFLLLLLLMAAIFFLLLLSLEGERERERA